MKKLMVILSVALVAAVSQAAQIQWGITAGPTTKRLLDYSGSAAFAGTAYLILTSDASAFTTQLAKDGTIGTTATYGQTTSFNSSTGATASKEMASADTLTATATDFSVLLVQTVGETVYYKVSSGMNATPSTDLVNNPVKLNWTASTQFTDSWSSFTPGSSIPEPTSGLLMLLGVAGLALRRRHS